MDTYQPIYDAVRSKISGCDTDAVIRGALRDMDIGIVTHHVQCMLQEVSAYHTAPHVLMRPSIYPDGNQWCALYGENLQDGVAGFGDTPEKACVDFDRNWTSQELQKI